MRQAVGSGGEFICSVVLCKKSLPVIGSSEDFFVVDRIFISNDDKLLPVFNQLRHIFAEEREGRVGDDDVGLLEEFNALRRAKVAVALKLADANFLRVGNSVAIPVAKVFQPNRPLTLVPRKEVALLVLVAGGDESFQPQSLELICEIVEEVGDARVIAVAKDSFTPKVFLVMAEFVFDVRKLRVELILFRLLRRVQVAVCHVRLLS